MRIFDENFSEKYKEYNHITNDEKHDDGFIFWEGYQSGFWDPFDFIERGLNGNHDNIWIAIGFLQENSKKVLKEHRDQNETNHLYEKHKEEHWNGTFRQNR